MRPPRRALASTGSTAGGVFLRASQTSIAPSKRPPSIGPPNAARGATRWVALRRTSKGMPKIRICAALTTLVITATHKPAIMPTPIARAVMPNSLARKRVRMVASAISAGRGTGKSRRRTSEPILHLCSAGSALPRALSHAAPLSVQKAPCRRDGSFLRARRSPGYAQYRANCGHGYARHAARHKR